MLVLTRRAGESVMIGDDVVITVLEARGDVIRLGIQAPRDVRVHREEVYRELQAANREAASPTDAVVDELSRTLRPPSEPDAPQDNR
ncbi:carbon storage regulator CsrA [Actinoplanes sp. NPDC051470]|uniref:carbon storage regulator CsrA n=1 Tax=Actinoplanes sp. NPDC051470 TaxID=3157224 RepID=UPI003442BFA2